MLRDFPLDADQVVVAGVIDSVTNFVEHPKMVADRIERVARGGRRSDAGARRHRLRLRHLGRARRVAEDVVWAKLAALGEGARIASKRLF